jgi:hypothetical protein
VLTIRRQVARPWSCTDTGLGVVDEQRVRLANKIRAIRVAAHVGTGVPQDSISRLHRMVHSDGVGLLVDRARRQYVDVRGGDGERGVVPCKGDPVTDLVVLRTLEGVRRDHLDTSWLHVVAEVGDLGLAGSLGGLVGRVLAGRLCTALRCCGLLGFGGLVGLLGSFRGRGLLLRRAALVLVWSRLAVASTRCRGDPLTVLSSDEHVPGVGQGVYAVEGVGCGRRDGRESHNGS